MVSILIFEQDQLLFFLMCLAWTINNVLETYLLLKSNELCTNLTKHFCHLEIFLFRCRSQDNRRMFALCLPFNNRKILQHI